MTVVAVTIGVLVVAVILERKLRQWDREDATARDRLIVDDAERIVREANRRRNHPSMWHREP